MSQHHDFRKSRISSLDFYLKWRFRRVLVAGFLLTFAVAARPAAAQLDLSIGIGIAPPPPRVEVIPEPRPGFIWAPGYWEWEGGQHVWMAGHWIGERPGYVWIPDRWEEHEDEGGHGWHHARGHWEHGHDHGHDHGHHHGHDDDR